MADDVVVSNNLVIGTGVTFKGSISAPGKAIVNGNVTGVVNAREIDVHGELNQDIVCREHILIHTTGRVSGSLEYSELEIQRGGQFRGNMKQR